MCRSYRKTNQCVDVLTYFICLNADIVYYEICSVQLCLSVNADVRGFTFMFSSFVICLLFGASSLYVIKNTLVGIIFLYS